MALEDFIEFYIKLRQESSLEERINNINEYEMRKTNY